MHRFVLVRVERRAVGVDALEAGLLEHRHELRADAAHAVAHLLRLGRVGAGHAAERAVERVEHREEVLDERSRGALDERGLLAQHPLAVVLEVGLDPPQRVDELVALALAAAARSDSTTAAASATAVSSVEQLAVDHVVAASPFGLDWLTPLCSPGSSTISASATSSSFGADAPGARRRRRRRPRSGPAAPARRAAARSPGCAFTRFSCAALDRLDVGAGERVLQLLERGVDLLLVVGLDLVGLVLQQLLGLEDERVGVVADLRLLAPDAVLLGVRLGVLHHPVDLVLARARCHR